MDNNTSSHIIIPHRAPRINIPPHTSPHIITHHPASSYITIRYIIHHHA